MSNVSPLLKPLVRPLTRAITEAGVGFSPLSLFGTGESGVLWLVEAGKVWQDTAATIPANPGDSIARVDDQSGNNNPWYLSGAVCRADANGVWYAEHNGSGSVHESSAAAAFANAHLCAWIGQAATSTAAQILLDYPLVGATVAPGTGGIGYYSGFGGAAGAADPTCGQAVMMGAALIRADAKPVTLTSPLCVAIRANRSATTKSTALRGNLGATAFSVISPDVFTGAAWPAAKIGAGARNNTTLRFSGGVYFIAIRNAETSDSLDTSMRQWGTNRIRWYKPFAPGSVVDVLVVAGQSNAEGRGNSALSPAVIPGAGGNWSSGIKPLKDPVGGAITGSSWPTFANAYYAASGRSVLVVEVAAGGSGLIAGVGTADWSPTGTLRGAAVTAANAAIAAVSADASITLGDVHVAWIQGEQDATEYNGTTITGPLYQAALEALITYFQANITGMDSFVVSELGARNDGANAANWTAIRQAQVSAVAASVDSYIGFSGAKDFPAQGKMADNVHYDQVGLNEIGAALAACIAGLTP